MLVLTCVFNAWTTHSDSDISKFQHILNHFLFLTDLSMNIFNISSSKWGQNAVFRLNSSISWVSLLQQKRKLFFSLGKVMVFYPVRSLNSDSVHTLFSYKHTEVKISHQPSVSPGTSHTSTPALRLRTASVPTLHSCLSVSHVKLRMKMMNYVSLQLSENPDAARPEVRLLSAHKPILKSFMKSVWRPAFVKDVTASHLKTQRV